MDGEEKILDDKVEKRLKIKGEVKGDLMTHPFDRQVIKPAQLVSRLIDH